MGPGQTLAMAAKLLWDTASGQFSSASLRRLLGVSSTAARIKQHYQRFPENPALFAAWVEQAKVYWGED